MKARARSESCGTNTRSCERTGQHLRFCRSRLCQWLLARSCWDSLDCQWSRMPKPSEARAVAPSHRLSLAYSPRRRGSRLTKITYAARLPIRWPRSRLSTASQETVISRARARANEARRGGVGSIHARPTAVASPFAVRPCTVYSIAGCTLVGRGSRPAVRQPMRALAAHRSFVFADL